MNKIALTDKEMGELIFMVNSQISWGNAGCYGDGDEITDKSGFETAQKVLKKIIDASKNKR